MWIRHRSFQLLDATLNSINQSTTTSDRSSTPSRLHPERKHSGVCTASHRAVGFPHTPAELSPSIDALSTIRHTECARLAVPGTQMSVQRKPINVQREMKGTPAVGCLSPLDLAIVPVYFGTLARHARAWTSSSGKGTSVWPLDDLIGDTNCLRLESAGP